MKIPSWSDADHHLREVLRGASVAFVFKLLGAGLAFVFSALLARMLGAAETGLFFLALAVASVATILGRLGLDNTLVRFTAAHSAVGDWSAVKGVYRQGMLLAQGSALLVSLLLFAIAPWLATAVFSKPELSLPLRWMTMAVLPLVLLMLHAQALKGLKRIRDASLVEWHGVWISLFSLVGLYLLVPHWGLDGAIVSYILGAWLTALIGVWYWRRAAVAWGDVPAVFDRRTLLANSLPLFWVASMNHLMAWTSIFLLGILASTTDVAIYGAASRTALLTSAVLLAVNSIAAPKFAALHRQGDTAALARVAKNSAKLMIALTIPAFSLFMIFPGWVMGWFGPEFIQGAVVLVILAMGEFISVATGSVGYLLMMTGHERLVRNNNILAALLNIALNLILIPSFGMVGAAIATGVSVAVKNLYAAYWVAKRLGIHTIPFVGGR